MRLPFLFFLSLSLFLISPTVRAKRPTDSMTKFDWLRLEDQELRRSLCGGESYMLRCFSISDSQCTSAVSDAVKTCGRTAPQILKFEDGYYDEALELGACVGLHFEEKFALKKSREPACVEREEL